MGDGYPYVQVYVFSINFIINYNNTKYLEKKNQKINKKKKITHTHTKKKINNYKRF